MIKKSSINPLPEYFDRYINLVNQEDLSEALIYSEQILTRLNVSELLQIGSDVYAPNKWTINQIFQHLLDTERIFTYRALVFARNDSTVLPGFSENNYAEESNANNRKLREIIDELIVVRKSTILLFESFNPTLLQRTGVCYNKVISVGAIGFTLVGHQIHHKNVIEERYLPLMEKHQQN